MGKARHPAPEPESLRRYEDALRGPDVRVRYTWLFEGEGERARAVVMLQVRMESGQWREAFREGEVVARATADSLMGAWFRGCFRLWTRFAECAHDDLVALCRWEVGAQELRRP